MNSDEWESLFEVSGQNKPSVTRAMTYVRSWESACRAVQVGCDDGMELDAMATFYTVVQFVPDPVADERINAGVIVFGGGRILVRFVENWNRLQRFGNKDVSFLRQFASDLSERAHGGTAQPQLTEQMLREMVNTWRNAIQFTPPRGSLLSLEELLVDTEARFLANDHPQQNRPATRWYMKRLAFDATCLAFVRRGGERARKLVKRNFNIGGAITGTRSPWRLPTANRSSPPRSFPSWEPIAKPRRRPSWLPPGHLRMSESDMACSNSRRWY